MFIAEIMDQQDIQAEKVFIDENVIAEFSALSFGEQLAPQIEEAEKEFIERLLEKFVMNVTALNNYLKCPLDFYFKNLVRIPSHQRMRLQSSDHLFIMLWNNYSAKCKTTASSFLPKKNLLKILNGICSAIVKVLPTNNLTGEWNTVMKC